MRTATAQKETAAPMPQWDEDFRAMVTEVIQQNRDSITEELEKAKRLNRDLHGEELSAFLEDSLLLTAVGVFILTKGTDAQRQTLKTWVDNMSALKDGKEVAP